MHAASEHMIAAQGYVAEREVTFAGWAITEGSTH